MTREEYEFQLLEDKMDLKLQKLKVQQELMMERLKNQKKKFLTKKSTVKQKYAMIESGNLSQKLNLLNLGKEISKPGFVKQTKSGDPIFIISRNLKGTWILEACGRYGGLMFSSETEENNARELLVRINSFSESGAFMTYSLRSNFMINGAEILTEDDIERFQSDSEADIELGITWILEKLKLNEWISTQI